MFFNTNEIRVNIIKFMNNSIILTDGIKEDILFFLDKYSKENCNNFCVIKLDSDFPKLRKYQDLDIVTSDIQNFKNNIFQFFSSDQYSISITKDTNNQIHFDLKYYNEFIFRFDVYFNKYESKYFILKKNFYKDLLDSSEIFKLEFNKKYFEFHVPNLEYELLIRVLELKKFPKKIHHKKFIKRSGYDLSSLTNFVNNYANINVRNLILLPSFFISIKNIYNKLVKVLKRHIFRNNLFLRLAFTNKNLKKLKDVDIDIGWTKIQITHEIILPVDMLRVNVYKNSISNYVRIEDTPHYKYLKNWLNNKSEKEFKEYLIDSYDEVTEFNVKEKLENFIKLYKELEHDFSKAYVVIVLNKNLILKGQGFVFDGAHRLAILKLLNVKKVKCYLKEI